MLLRTNYAEEPGYGADGSEDHFAMNRDGRPLAGWVWTPERDTKPGRLEGIAFAMKDYCLSKTPKDRDTLNGRIDDLLALLK